MKLLIRTMFISLAVVLMQFNISAQSVLDSLLFEYEEQIGSLKIETGIRISRHYDNDNLFKSLEYGIESLAFSNEFGTNTDLLKSYNRLGIVYYKLGDLAKSNDNFLSALTIINKIKDPDISLEGRLMNNIANNYGELKQEGLAIAYYKKSLALKKEMHDTSRYSITLNNMALTYSSMQYYDSAYLHLKQALVYDKLLQDEMSEAYTKGSLGEIFLDEGKADSAVFYLSESLMFFEQIEGSDYVLGYYHQKLGESEILLNHLQVAQGHFSLALEFSINVGAKPIQRDCYKGLQAVSEKLNNYQKAFEYSQLYAAMQDTLFEAESAQKLSAIETSYQIKNKEQEISILNSSAQIDQYKFYGAAGLAIVVMILFGFMYYRYLFKEKANYILQQKNDTIQKQNKEIMDSVEYAKGIQEAILPDFTTIESFFSAAYLYYKPTQVVSGDFYWVDEVDGNTVLVLADGTGHGVPGAFLSVMGSSILRQVIAENKLCKPDEILAELNRKVVEGLGQSKLSNTLKDGMDVAVCTYNKNKSRLAFAGAKRPIILKRGNNVELIKGNRQSIGGDSNVDVKFDIHHFDISKGNSIVFYTDGVIDQFGGEDNKKFLAKRLIEIVEEEQGIHNLKERFAKEIKIWQNGGEQTDDMLLLAVEI